MHSCYIAVCWFVVSLFFCFLINNNILIACLLACLLAWLIDWYLYPNRWENNVCVPQPYILLLLMAPWTLSETTRVSWYQKGKTNLDLLKQELLSGSGISWAMCKSAPCPSQVTTPITHHSVFYRPDALPAAQPTASKHWRHIPKPYIKPNNSNNNSFYFGIIIIYLI